MKTMSRVLALCAFLLAGGGLAQAQDADVGLVNQVAGDVTYSSGAGGGKVQPFMKMRRGDRYSVAAGAQIRVVYFQGGRQETWRGPSSFQSGAEHSEALSGAVHQVASLPAAVPQKMQKIPEMIKMAQMGGVQVRGLKSKPQPGAEQQSELAAARASYAELRRQLPSEDITPELYLFAVLQDHLLYEEMKTLVDDMQRRQPGSAEAAQLAEWLNARLARSK